MPKMTPKQALRHISSCSRFIEIHEEHEGCPKCAEALSILRALVEGLTVQEVRKEIDRKLTESRGDYFPSVTETLRGLLDLIDRKEE